MTQSIISRGVSERHSYAVANTGHVMNILSDHLYSDKIKSVIRELLTNAYDAHLVNKSTCPVKITLPTTQNPIFSIRDYGTGLCHDDIIDMYRFYGVSNKSQEDTNTMGYMGIGSKSPFAYVDSFSTISYYNGTKSVYISTKDENGMAAIHLLSETETDEPNGLDVSFAVKTGDIYDFTNDTTALLTHFPDDFCPLDIKKEKTEAALSGNGWYVHRSYLSEYYLIVGNIEYKIDRCICTSISPVVRGIVYIYCNPHDVSVSASRESLQYNKKTLAFLNKKIAAVHTEIRTLAQNKIDKCHSFFSACAYVGIFLSLETYTYNNLKITNSFSYDRDDLKTHGIRLLNCRKHQVSHNYSYTTLFVNDCKNGYNRIREWAKQNNDKSVFVIPEKNKQIVCDYIHATEQDLKYASSLPEAKKVSSGAYRTVYKVFRYEGSGYWHPISVDKKIDHDVYFVPLYKNDIVYCTPTDKHYYSISYLSHVIELNNLITGEDINKKDVLGVPIRFVKSITRNGHYKDLLLHIEQNLKNSIINNKMEFFKFHIYRNHITRELLNFLSSSHHKIKDNTFSQLYNVVSPYGDKEHLIYSSPINRLIKTCCEQKTITNIENECKILLGKISKKYPLTRLIDGKYYDSFVDYINLTYKQKEKKNNG